MQPAPYQPMTTEWAIMTASTQKALAVNAQEAGMRRGKGGQYNKVTKKDVTMV